MNRARRLAGAAAGSTLALALLVSGCVFAAVAGPALSLHTRTEALSQTLSALGSTDKAVEVSSDWAGFTGALEQNGGFLQNLTATQLTQSTSQIGGSLAATPLPLAPGAWMGMNTKPLSVTSGAAVTAIAEVGGPPPELEVAYRNPLPSNARLVAGSYAATAVPAGTVPVAVTTQTAARFGLRPGSRLVLKAPSGPVALVVTAIVTERGAASSFWTADTTVAVPSLNIAPPGRFASGPAPYWVGGVFADPGGLAAMQNAFSGTNLDMRWEFPLGVGGVNADQAQGLYADLNRATLVAPTLTGNLAPATDALAVSSPLIAELSAFIDAQAATQTVLLLLFVSMIVAGAAVILVTATAITARRDGELTMMRARGGSLRQVAGLMLRSTAMACVPAALAGAVLATVLVPRTPGPTVEPSSVLAWCLAGTALLAALAGPPLIAAWQHRRPAPARNPAQITTAETARSSSAWLRRVIVEVTACTAAVAGLVVLHHQGVPANGGVNVYIAAAPVLVAVLAVVIMLRLYPLVIRGLLRLSARGAGATGFVAMTGAARTSLTGVLPAFGLVLALSLATFAGMLGDGITRGEIAASWQATGADVTIQTASPSIPATPEAVRALAAVHGVRHVTAVWNTLWLTPAGLPLTAVAVDPADYAALVAGTPFPRIPAGLLGPASGASLAPAATLPVLASPSAAARLGSAVTGLMSTFGMGPITVRIAGQVGSTPAQPGGGVFIIMPLQTLPGPRGVPAPNMVLITGSGIDYTQLGNVLAAVLPGAIVRVRSTVLADLANSPLQHGAALIVTLTVAAAAGFALFILVIGLTLGAADRELTLARLAVMGHQRAARLVMAEALPAVAAAVIAGVACALALPRLIGSAVDLSGFTGTGLQIQLQPDVTAFVLPAVALLLIAAVTLTAEAEALRRRGVTGVLRAN
jgi:putative ABC transport system permease protein